MRTKKLVTTSMLLALAVILSVMKLFELPFGGTITPASMMPVVLAAYLYGTRWGLFSAFVYSVLQLVTGMGTVSVFFLPGDSRMALHAAILVCLCDYIIAFTLLGFAGVFKNKLKNHLLSLVLGTVLVCMLRYLVHVISGAVFFGAWAEWFFSDSTGLSQISLLRDFCKWVMSNVSGKSLCVLYSVIYNGSFMIPETVITAITVPVVYKVIRNSDSGKVN